VSIVPEPVDPVLLEQQYALALHVRDPAAHAGPPGIEARRLAVYRELFQNGLLSLLGDQFPVLRATLGANDWDALVLAFYRDFRCQTPLFTEVGREFVRYLEEREGAPGDSPWLAELAHYEWVELALMLSDASAETHDPQGDLLTGRPMPSPLAWALAYAWPVHRIAPGYQPDTPPDNTTLLLARRDSEGRVRFAELSPLVYRLLERLDGVPELDGRAQLEALADEAQATDHEAFLADGHAMLLQLHAEGVLLGTRA
jgi:hypothetical protein